MTSPLVSVSWLQSHLTDPNLVLLDATMANAVIPPEVLTDYEYIPGARHFDIDSDFCDTNAPFPHTVASDEQFTTYAQKLGINHDSKVVVYDARGVYSAPRAWWLLKSMGLDDVSVLNGGLLAWKAAGLATQPTKSQATIQGDFIAKRKDDSVYGADDVHAKIGNEQVKIIDVRGRPRFLGEVAEPRPGVRAGHIPTALNLPFPTLLDGYQYKDEAALRQAFSALNIEEHHQLICSCGSGITACIVLLAARVAGYSNITLYDGSWTEWGSLHHLPIEK